MIISARGFAAIRSSTSASTNAAIEAALRASQQASPLAYTNDKHVFEKVQRQTIFWSEMFPIYLHYRYYEDFKLKGMPAEERAAAWDALHRQHAPQVLKLFLKLKGIYIKVGQVLASRSDIAPQIYRDHLSTLLDNVPALEADQSRQIVENAMGRRIDEIFAEFDDHAIGAASIGQVHKAKLHDGREVVVKIQYPNAFELFGQDIGTAKQMAELERQVLEEFNFEKEAWALETVRNNIMPHFKNVIVPKPIKELSNAQVLVMEYIPGVKLVDGFIAEAKRNAARLGVTLEQLQAGGLTGWQKTLLGTRYAANYTADLTWNIVSACYNWTFGWIAPNMPYTPQPINIRDVFETLVKVHGREILIDGVFNGDPHPGNILITPSGKLGLIDYGQVKSLTRKQRRDLAHLILYLHQGESAKQQTIDLIRSMGFETQRNNDHVLYKTCVIAFDRDDPEACEGMNLQQYLEYLNKTDSSKRIPEDYVMAVRTCIILRGMAFMMGAGHISIANQWKQLAEEALRLFPEDPVRDNEKPTFVRQPFASA
eukprot:jgi/Hompol1/6912/HPOL_002364-RA